MNQVQIKSEEQEPYEVYNLTVENDNSFKGKAKTYKLMQIQTAEMIQRSLLNISSKKYHATLCF